MLTGGYTLAVCCDCKECNALDFRLKKKDEFVGQTYTECAKLAKNEGWTISSCKRYCSAPEHGEAVKE